MVSSLSDDKQFRLLLLYIHLWTFFRFLNFTPVRLQELDTSGILFLSLSLLLIHTYVHSIVIFFHLLVFSSRPQRLKQMWLTPLSIRYRFILLSGHITRRVRIVPKTNNTSLLDDTIRIPSCHDRQTCWKSTIKRQRWKYIGFWHVTFYN